MVLCQPVDVRVLVRLLTVNLGFDRPNLAEEIRQVALCTTYEGTAGISKGSDVSSAEGFTTHGNPGSETLSLEDIVLKLVRLLDIGPQVLILRSLVLESGLVLSLDVFDFGLNFLFAEKRETSVEERRDTEEERRYTHGLCGKKSRNVVGLFFGKFLRVRRNFVLETKFSRRKFTNLSLLNRTKRGEYFDGSGCRT